MASGAIKSCERCSWSGGADALLLMSADWAGRVACRRRIGYDNFKSSVRERRRHDAYMKVWRVMARWGQAAQNRPQESSHT